MATRKKANPRFRAARPSPDPHDLSWLYEDYPLEDASKQIRLLRLSNWGTKPTQAFMRFELSVWDLKAAPQYRAISYTWGQSGASKSIFIESEEVQVRPNCLYALWQVCQHFPDDYIWIDSICIQQDSIHEKNHQVKMMGLIYAFAASASASLGRHEHGSEWIMTTDLSTVNDTTLPGRGVRAKLFNHLFQRPYWYRLWIVQELCLARDVYVHCGKDIVDWTLIYQAMEQAAEHNAIPKYVKTLGDLIQDCVVFERVRPLVLHETFDAFAEAQCENPRDKVYGLLNLLEWETTEFDNEHTLLDVDYSLSTVSLLLQVAKWNSIRMRLQSLLVPMLQALRIPSWDESLSALIDARTWPFETPEWDLDQGSPYGDIMYSQWASLFEFDLTTTDRWARVFACLRYDKNGLLTASSPVLANWIPHYSFTVDDIVSVYGDVANLPPFHPVFVNGMFVAILTARAQAGDFIVESTGFLRASHKDADKPSLQDAKQLLVIRYMPSDQYQPGTKQPHTRQFFEIIGQGVIMPGFSLDRGGERTQDSRRQFFWRFCTEDAFVTSAQWHLRNVASDPSAWLDVANTSITRSRWSSIGYHDHLMPYVGAS